MYSFIIFIDINPCTLGSHNCSQICINMPGSYMCGCKDGYSLMADEQSCLGIYLKLNYLT